MKILSMTATFGKLEGQTLTFQEGLNVINAPNEWGKSTWCAFIVAMLYGIETSQRSSAKGLADKERYAPWSGKPMSGRMDILWQGRKITLERSTKGRSIFGLFRAYETESGLDVAELTAENCGQVLLGVEKSVFTRSAFLRFSDLPVTQDEALRRRLNALVTTGDESGASDKLAEKLKDLKNKCRHNKTGLLPQAETALEDINTKLQRLEFLRAQTAALHQSIAAAEEDIRNLKNHRDALRYDASLENTRRVQDAAAKRDQAAAHLQTLTAQCAALPSQEVAEQELQQLEDLQLQWSALQEETLPPPPQQPQTPLAFVGMDGAQAVARATADKAALDGQNGKNSKLMMVAWIVSLCSGAFSAIFNWIIGLSCLLVAALSFVLWRMAQNEEHQKKAALCARYADLPPESWLPTAQEYEAALAAYTLAKKQHNDLCDDWNCRRNEMLRKMDAKTGGRALSLCIQENRQILATRETLTKAQTAWELAAQHASTLAEVAKEVPPPAFPDALTWDAAKTEQLLAEANFNHQQLNRKLGETEGQMQPLGSKEALLQQKAALNARIQKLEKTYQALALAQQTLTTAANELQRQFAPRIAKSAQAMFAKLTGGRYDRLSLAEDLTLSTGAEGEDVLHGSQWRSDGTVDQLYLSLRLAVAAELTPDAPLVLDDALVRFDDTRVKEAMALLTETSAQKQVIVFTCQTRESTHL